MPKSKINPKRFQKNVVTLLQLNHGTSLENCSITELYSAVSKAAMAELEATQGFSPALSKDKNICYLSMEFLTGKMVYANLINMELYNAFTELMEQSGRAAAIFEDIEDAALGNGGLGRLAACFLDSGATNGICLNGFGIRYKYGLFKQIFENGCQKELPDDWLRHGDPWSVRREEEKVLIKFKDQSVYAVPYDYPVIGYGASTINYLRLWQAEPLEKFDFEAFNNGKFKKSEEEQVRADAICNLLYPNDSTDAGKKLRLKQQYFFAGATIRFLTDTYKKNYGSDFSKFPAVYAIQLNDTHPVVAIPELLRILIEENGYRFDEAFRIAKDTFAYTNHTILSEALEKWDVILFRSVLPQLFKYVRLMHEKLAAEAPDLFLIKNNLIHMANIAIYASHSTNGVAGIHTEILKNRSLKEWYELYPERFNNKTNGITQRRWLLLCNPELSSLITENIGDGWITNLDEIKQMEDCLKKDKKLLDKFNEIKKLKKQQLADYIKKHEDVTINPDFIFDIQAKRLHEYKRQLLNALSILHFYFEIKDGNLTDFTPTTFIFGAKAAPGYYRAKAIIKLINEIAALIAADEKCSKYLQVVFVHNYNVSYAEKLMPAADISEQISMAGTEASGTGNMKFMLNGAVTLGTYDGANVEIVEEAGFENNYIFGLRVEDIEKQTDYNAMSLYENDPSIRRVLDALVDGTLSDDGTGMFKELFDALLYGASWHEADHYRVLADFHSYNEARLNANRDYKDVTAFRTKCFINMANAGRFSSDRTIREYTEEIWR